MDKKYEIYDPNKTYKIGDKYIIEKGCWDCGSDTVVRHMVASYCVNSIMIKKENPTCNFMLMGG